MEYRKLGSSGVRVSEVSLGSWLTFGHSVDQATTNRCVRAALECGINLIDTADVYALGACETALGEALGGVPRRQYVLATKCFFPTGDGPNDRGLSRKHVRESLDASLVRLRTDYVDLYQCHRFDPETPLAELVRTMDDLVRSGRILYWGVSLWPAAKITEICELARAMHAVAPITNQPPYNMLERDIERDVIPACAAQGLSQIVYSPLAQGLLTGKYKGGTVPKGSRAADPRSNQFIITRMSPENLGKVEALIDLAREAAMPLARLALAWCLHQPNVASVIIGATKPEHVKENAEAAGLKLDAGLLARIEQILDLR
jgi:aryl-alcohol dehydrogenase-like predicted oxidoreductase